MTELSQEASAEAESIYKGQKSILVMVIGKSGRGKSTALRNLPVDKTHIINVIGKPLPFQAGLKYVPGKNMTISADPNTIRRTMMEVSRANTVEHLVIEDAQYIMATEFMDKAMVKGYDKFTMMARNIWEILVLSTKLREGLKIYFLAHEEDTGNERKMKTLGKLLDDKITPEGLSTIVLYADVTGERDNRRYFFSTQSDGITNAKSPFGMFPSMIPNDLMLVSQRVDEYYKGVELKNSKLNFNV
jgi:hypothetical protein